jgi:hypothetical protein
VDALLGPKTLWPWTMFGCFANFHVYLSKNCKGFKENHEHRKLQWTFAYENPLSISWATKMRPTHYRTLRSSSGVKMKEIEDVYCFALYGNGQLSRDMCFKSMILRFWSFGYCGGFLEKILIHLFAICGKFCMFLCERLFLKNKVGP